MYTIHNELLFLSKKKWSRQTLNVGFTKPCFQRWMNGWIDILKIQTYSIIRYTIQTHVCVYVDVYR